MSKSTRNRIFFILAITAAALFFTFPIEKHIKFGLDLEGGMHIVLRVDASKLPEKSRNDAVLKAIDILRNRIDSLGVGETLIQRQGNDSILIQLPGVTNRDEALAMIGKVAQLEFRLVVEDPAKLKEALSGNETPGYVLRYIKKEQNEPILLEEKVALSGEIIEDAMVDVNTQSFGQYEISLQLNSKGAKDFGDITKNNVNRRLAIILDNEVLSAPNINEPILGGRARITGQFSYDEASLLSRALKHGSLPAPIIIEEERTIGPLLGKDSIISGIKAVVLGGILVFAFILLYYLGAGLIPDIALALNILLIFGTMGLLNYLLPQSKITLTLPGIAGIILTIGMAVDANILINERIREELRNGKPLSNAVSNGFNRALSAIIDSNITTIVAAFMLFQFGSGPIKGFAVTLTIGLVCSLFTAVFVTRTIYSFLIETKILKELKMLNFFPKTNINFIGMRHVCIAISLILAIASIVTFINRKDTMFGIDFSGGQLQEYRFERPIKADDLRTALKKVGLEDATIQITKAENTAKLSEGLKKLGIDEKIFKQSQEAAGTENVLIRTSEDTYEKVNQAFKESFADNPFTNLRIEKVGPSVGQSLRQRALLAIIFALAGILLYVGFRFKHFDFATAGVIALLHDVLISAGILVMLNRQIDLLIVSALLSIAGFSINDTIVIYDRIRENWHRLKKQTLAQVINDSLNETLSRTILTNLTAFMVVLSLYLVGGEILNSFALCLIIGFVAGTYSTVFIASPLVLAWQKKKK
ncbi:MAG: protein translocase subunit SecD [Candidatus Omnitrophica bacterium]|nr:protein translocase subunit SecD [Candidatus Omnitrophota bacterium]